MSNLQKTLKASAASPSSGPAPAGAASNQDADQPAEPRDPASSQEPRQPGKKSSKVKGWVQWICIYCKCVKVCDLTRGEAETTQKHFECRQAFYTKGTTESLHRNYLHFSKTGTNISEIEHIKYVWPCRTLCWNCFIQNCWRTLKSSLCFFKQEILVIVTSHKLGTKSCMWRFFPLSFFYCCFSVCSVKHFVTVFFEMCFIHMNLPSYNHSTIKTLLQTLN